MKENYLKELNEPQRQAVEDIKGPSLIIAGAGSGKTKVLTCRIAHMLEQGIPASAILALTFTNKAAKEMKDRVSSLVGSEKVRYLWMGTFHSVFARILRTEAQVLDFPRNFTIYDKSDSKSAIKSCIKELKLDEKVYPPSEVMSRISRAKNNLMTASAYAADDQAMQADEAARKPRMADIYALYARKCRLAGAMDFDDLLLYTNILFQQNPQILALYRDRFRYILVDEYQDTNLAQYLIITALAREHRNIAVVGDDAQSIYAFRGARIENILNFSKDFPEAKEYRLEQNYRSTQTVVNAANSLIKHNARRMRKECFAQSETGEKIALLCAYTDAEEAFLVVSSILDKVYRSREGYGEFAVLYRTNAQSRLLEEALRKRNIPYKVYGGFSFYERAEVKDMMAYMRLVVNPDDEEAFRRAVVTPSRGIGDVSLQKLGTAALFAGMSSIGYIRQGDLEAAGLRGNIAGRLKAFSEMIETVYNMQEEGANAYQVAMEVARLSGYLPMLREDKSIEGMSRLNNVEELLNSIQAYCGMAAEGVELETEVSVPDAGEAAPTLERFLKNVTLLTQMDGQEQPDNERVSLMTVHSAKGLEFSHIYVVGMEEKLFPSLLSSNTQTELEEERRLFYVAMTRAKKSLTLSFSRTRMHWGNMESNPPSRFLREIDPGFLNQPVPDVFGSGTEEQEGRSTWSREGKFGSGGGKFGSREGKFGSGGGRAGFEGGNTWAGRRNSFGASTPADRPGGQGFKAGGASARDSFKAPGGTSGKEGFSTPGGTPGPADFQAADASSLTVGMYIEHDRFGRGRILSLEGEMPNTRAVIEFEFGGAKTLLLKFARLRKL
ncbi:MAG TPA: 3'-5' exonuclease [Bacteroidales bacterium]|jgi:DNA helicase-2/ATP-dependent DNA helicase PcrA|nr:ATP-dependent DNA helicase Rep [Bacteroidales bacterium]OQC57187.1 MAG: ATP-dependent DNA helicase PcrA [Bacteroidetes bacterium ADurb.Bin013]MCZ2316650.1 UvrD-helicase domain-containing protein [Bacteroidales bacterium]NLZ09422.1 UvrD-helicase domain-containing protein [Bacteroidales bacterium]HNW22400.1 3'-5' exonuclease [Bacteroidales bacterium]